MFDKNTFDPTWPTKRKKNTVWFVCQQFICEQVFKKEKIDEVTANNKVTSHQ